MACINHSYFVVAIDYGRRGVEAVVDPEITRREVLSRIATGEYKNIAFVHEIADWRVIDVTDELLAEAKAGATDADALTDRRAASVDYARDHARDHRKHGAL